MTPPYKWPIQAEWPKGSISLSFSIIFFCFYSLHPCCVVIIHLFHISRFCSRLPPQSPTRTKTRTILTPLPTPTQQLSVCSFACSILTYSRVWSRNWLCMNWARSLLSIHCMLLGYSFKPRPYSRALGTKGSVMTIVL